MRQEEGAGHDAGTGTGGTGHTGNSEGGAPEEYKRKKEQARRGLRDGRKQRRSWRWRRSRRKRIGDDPDMIWSELEPVMMKRRPEQFGVREEEEVLPPGMADELWDAIMQVRGVRTL